MVRRLTLVLQCVYEPPGELLAPFSARLLFSRVSIGAPWGMNGAPALKEGEVVLA